MKHKLYSVWNVDGKWKVQLEKHIETFRTKKQAVEFVEKWQKAGKGESVFMS